VHLIEATYHRRRCKAAGKFTTIEFETNQELAATAASGWKANLSIELGAGF
jgi:hypothetical protein